MSDTILVVNAGSSSIKFSVFAVHAGALEPSLRGKIEGLPATPRFVCKNTGGNIVAERTWAEGTRLGHDAAIGELMDFLQRELADDRVIGVGHRVVHGGNEFTAPVRVSAEVIDKLDDLIRLAPLHQPRNLAPIELLRAQAPHLAQVACFDTAFHKTLPALEQAFALPPEITDLGVRRYGFHGLSYEYIASALPRLDADAAAGRVVVLHLGSGASMCALRGGRSIASSMGFTALDGLPMGTRCGSLDAGVILYLIDELKMDAREVERLLYKQSGLLGVSGVSNDMRTLEASDDPRAHFAIDLFTYRIGRELGALAATLGGLDAIVFTAGIGENSRSLREQVCRNARWLGVALDSDANARNAERISAPASKVSVWVIPTNEELMIARHTLALIDA